MPPSTNTRLFTLGGYVVQIAQISVVVAATTLVIALPLAVIFSDNALAMVNQHFAEPASTYPISAVAGLISITILMLALAWFFLGQLRQIIDTSLLGAAITDANADRLTNMAWLMLAIQLVKYPAAWLGLIVETAFKGPTSEVEVSGTLTGLLITIFLLMLAQIFRQGPATRHKLEGTV